jgi:hypothetical protein
MASDRRIAAAAAAILALGAAVAHAKPPLWDKRIDGPKRFKVLKAFAGEAVLDGETGLVWPRAPFASGTTWVGARQACEATLIGGRYGWRLPRIEELASLFVATWVLPDGHPFSGLESGGIWSATTASQLLGAQPGFARTVLIANGVGTTDKTLSQLVLCVRGSPALDEP